MNNYFIIKLSYEQHPSMHSVISGYGLRFEYVGIQYRFYILISLQRLNRYTFNIKINKMKRGFSPTRSKVSDQIHNRLEEDQRRIPISRAADYNKYFCHYNNAVYMGGMSSYKKHGKGVLLHDDGSAVITDYLHDTPSGHSVIFRQNSITSVFYKSNVQFQVAYKQGRYIVTIPFSDSSYKAHGVGVLIDYINFKIYRLVFKRGVLVQKIMHMDKRDNDDVFNKNTTTRIIGVKHEQAFNLSFEKPSRVHIKQEANKSTIGYFDQDGEIHGLSFTFYGQNIRTYGQKSLYLKFIEKGYYRDSTIETFGEKLFSNGNKYIGEFDKGQFHGYGILISPSEMKWVYGKFNRGQLQQIIESNYKKFTEHQFQVWAQSLRAIHRRYKQRWIDMDIELPQESYLYNTLKVVVESPTTYVDPDKVELIREDQERMSRIQQQFQKQYPGSTQNSYVEKQLDRHYGERNFGRTKLSTTKRAELDEQFLPRNNYTPVNKFQPINSRLKPLHNAQTEFREEDPFKIQLTKVPYDSDSEDYRPPVSRKSRLETRAPLEQSVLKSSKEKYLPYTYKPYDYGYRNNYRLPNYIDSIYDSTYLEELRKQRQRLNRIQDDQLYYTRLKRGLETSPVHRNYYSTPPKYEDPYPQRYVGKLTNKRVFNYPTTSKYYPEDELKASRVSPPSLYDSPRRNKSPKKPQIDQAYNSRVKGVSPKEHDQSRRNFIKNNYQYWNGT